MRPILFFPGWTTLLAGYWMASGLEWPLEVNWFPQTDKTLIKNFLGFGAAMGSIFIFNQLEDIESDQLNHKLFLLGEGFIAESSGWFFAIILATASLILSWFVGIQLLIIIICFLVISGYAYNYPPLTCKNYPIRGLFANMAMGALAFLAGWIVVEPLNLAAVIQGLPFLGYNTALYLLTTLPDAAGDKDTDKITIAVRLGYRTTLFIGFAVFFVTLVLSFFLENYLIFWLCVLLIPFGLIALFRQTLSATVLLLKMGILFFSLSVCCKFPLFFVMMIAAFVVSRWYYRRRFNLVYPTFGG